MKKVIAVALLALAAGVQAEPTAAKKELIAKLLQLQQPAIEALARSLAERPAAMMLQQAGVALQSRVAPEKRQAIAQELQADAKKYVDEVVPLVTDRAVKLSPSTIGVLMDEKFTEDELRQIIAIVESPVNKKFTDLAGQMQQALGEKLIADTQGVVEPKVKALEQSLLKRLGLPPQADGGAAGNKPAAKPAKK